MWPCGVPYQREHPEDIKVTGINPAGRRMRDMEFAEVLTVLALLGPKHRGLMEALERGGVDFARVFGERSLNSGPMIEIIDGLVEGV